MPEIIINGPAGRLQGHYNHSKKPNAPIAVVLHPHPRMGGTMNNRVVYTLFQSFVAKGFSTLRFNLRGVGRSQGQFDRGEGELSDATAALDWLQKVNPNAASVWVAGFSFGAWIGMQLLMRRPEIDNFISVALPAKHYDFSFLAPCPTSGLILQGNRDPVVFWRDSEVLVEKLRQQRGIDIDLRIIEGANHGFTGQQEEIARIIGDYLEEGMYRKRVEIIPKGKDELLDVVDDLDPDLEEDDNEHVAEA